MIKLVFFFFNALFYFFSFLSSVMVCCGLQLVRASISVHPSVADITTSSLVLSPFGSRLALNPSCLYRFQWLVSVLKINIHPYSSHSRNRSRFCMKDLIMKKQYFKIFRKGIYQQYLNNNKKLKEKKKLFNYINREHHKEKD